MREQPCVYQSRHPHPSLIRTLDTSKQWDYSGLLARTTRAVYSPDLNIGEIRLYASEKLSLRPFITFVKPNVQTLIVDAYVGVCRRM